MVHEGHVDETGAFSMSLLPSNTVLQDYCAIGEYDSIVRENDTLSIVKPLRFDNDELAVVLLVYLSEDKSSANGELRLRCYGDDVLYKTTHIREEEGRYNWLQVFNDLFMKLESFSNGLAEVKRVSDRTHNFVKVSNSFTGKMSSDGLI